MRKSNGAKAEVTFWSRGGATSTDPKLKKAAGRPASKGSLALEPEGRFYAGQFKVSAAGTLTLSVWSPRPIRMWIDGVLVLDEGIFWRSYQRELRGAVSFPCRAGMVPFLVEVGQRPVHPAHIDEHCPSRNREKVMAKLRETRPDVLRISGSVVPGSAPTASIRFLPNQFRKDGVIYQHVLLRGTNGMKSPSTDFWGPIDEPEEKIFLSSGVQPCAAIEATTDQERAHGVRRFYVPVVEPGKQPRAARGFGKDRRAEPSVEVAGKTRIVIEGQNGKTSVEMPIYESLGRLAPKQEFLDITWPEYKAAKPLFPEPVLPTKYAWMSELYYEAWEMLTRLVRHPKSDSGLPGPYISTGSGFKLHQFVWDTSFTAMSTAYGHRAIPAYCSLDLLYSRQFDGGYIHREHDIRDGLPALYEPDFSPNPPIMCVAEWANYSITGDLLRLRKVYPALKANHTWIQHNRKLPDGTYWTTGLANGLDNSPSLGDGYPCLSAQMAHEAETLAKIATALGLRRDAGEYRIEYEAVAEAINKRLWSDEMQIYSTSLPGGGHNTNKVVTAFWPLWAGVVPQDRVEALAQHLKDPSSFWRHHPIPSLAADSPYFQPGGSYWLGSTWAPTNFAAIKGFDRSGRHDLAVETALRHLQCMYEVYKSTGHIWENYCSEESKNGSWSMPDYCWSSVSPIALMLEVIIGIQVDAPNRILRWTPLEDETVGIRNLQMGASTVTACFRPEQEGVWLDTESDLAFTVELTYRGRTKKYPVHAGRQRTEIK